MGSRNLQKFLIVAVVLVLFAFVAMPSLYADQITVAAAGDLNFALRELAKRFEQKTGHTVQISFGSSGNLSAQIENGAPFDVFMSADVSYPERLVEKGLLKQGSLVRYGRGTLVVWVPPDSKLDPSLLRERLLTNDAVKRISIANPRHAPYGRAAEAALKRWGVYDRIKDKLVLGENVTQAAQFVESGNADAGLVALSLVLAKGEGKYWQVPDDAYPPLEQGAAIVASTKHPAAAQAFMDFLNSPEARRILETYGFRQ